MAKNHFPLTSFREAFGRYFGIEIEVLRQLLEIALVDDDPFVAAAVRRTLRAIVVRHAHPSVREVLFGGHYPMMHSWTTQSLWCRRICSSTVTSRRLNIRSSPPPGGTDSGR